MFKAGTAHKVKIEMPNGNVGYGRAVVIATDASRFWIRLNSAKDPRGLVPSGTNVCFVPTAPDEHFNGLWTTTIVGEKIFDGKTAFECASAKFSPLVQRRKYPRYDLNCPVMVVTDESMGRILECRSIDISRSGIALFAPNGALSSLVEGTVANLSINTQLGKIACACRVIRNNSNWLANTNEVGLEFIALTPTDTDMLDKLLESLRKPGREVAESQDTPEQAKATGLSAFFRGRKGDKSLIAGQHKGQDEPRVNTNKLRAMQSDKDKI